MFPPHVSAAYLELWGAGGSTLCMLISATGGCLAQIASVVFAQTSATQADNGFDAGPALFAFALAGVCLAALAAAGAALLGLIGVCVVVAVVVAAMMAMIALVAAVAALAHLVLAIIIWTRHPPTRVYMHPRWWGIFTLVLGVFAAIPFFVLHYRPGARPRCYNCGYCLRGLSTPAVCPECGKVRIQVVPSITHPT